jgi:hypothetical protein
MPWSRRLEDPIKLPDGRELVTLRDAAMYLKKLPATEHSLAHWQTATEALIMAAEDRGPVLHARIGMLQALNHGRPVRSLERPPRRAKVFRIIR